ncbi:sulfite exporter TauE/SafE family protein [Romeria aff. gracilis LEGE 07310]|uniref:Sulfite exporter TauE/SafE family protein n=1 Tax=Vasconcelosia minhoensis LEGE 07310 TaxID=915328 RepID=A0A8J7AQH8_9CYAN|nr:cytochrome c biogenesis protein CcdA [Romeria gracilis]MBE9078571.1 sulfite exporter TauE/SafE family protein [Romeria aff. gracilis LEGE 07310]
MWDRLQIFLYDLSQSANGWVEGQLGQLSPISIGVIALAGLLTSLTPCMLSILPITIGYMGSYEIKDRWQAAGQSMWFAFGLATTLAGLGIAASSLGWVYGQIGIGLPIVVSAIAILMGLNLLEALPLPPLPAFTDIDFLQNDIPRSIKSYLLGLTFGLVASPCSTPVLATLLAWVGQKGDPVLGSSLLLAYALGYVAPLVVAGIFTASIKQFLSIRKWSGWISPVSGVLLIGFGVFSLVSRLGAVV